VNEIVHNGHVHRIREITHKDEGEMDAVADLHIELLGFGPMAGLGRRFIKDACYANNMMDGQLKVAIYEIDGNAGGFVAYTDQSISFHRTSLKKHWARTAFTLMLSLLEDPRRLASLARALAVLGSRRTEHGVVGSDPMGEVVCVAVQPKYLKAGYRLASGSRPGESLVAFAAHRLTDLGVDEMRMLVDADNKAVLFLYRALGARFEQYEQAGEPMVQVWFDLNELVQGQENPWGRGERDFWQSHYDSMAHHESLDLFNAEARDYFSRLGHAVRLSHCRRVLDFGCGLGFVSELLATEVGKLYFWDYSENMLETARARLTKVSNSEVIDLSCADDTTDTNFDLIVVNSVIQYMSDEDFATWLGRWRNMLEKSGVLVISDVILPQPAFLTEVADSLSFSVKEGFLIRTLKQNFKQYWRYLKARRQATMTRYSKDDFSRRVEKEGFAIQFLPENLTYRTNRFSALLRPVSI